MPSGACSMDKAPLNHSLLWKPKTKKLNSQLTSLTRLLRFGDLEPDAIVGVQRNLCRSSSSTTRSTIRCLVCTLAIRGNGGLDAEDHGGSWLTFSKMCVEPRWFLTVWVHGKLTCKLFRVNWWNIRQHERWCISNCYTTVLSDCYN